MAKASNKKQASAAASKKSPAKKAAPAIKPEAKKPEPAKTVLVTGAAGFVGSHVVEEMISCGLNVVATDYPGANLAPARKAGAKTFEADITSAESVGELFKFAKPHYVVHLAALYDLGATRAQLMPPNRDGARNVFQAALDASVKSLVYFSTGDVYGQPKESPITEDFRPNPLNPYAESKLAAEKIALKMHARNGLPVVIIRPTVVYGPRSRYIASVFFSIPGIVRSIGDRINLDIPSLRVFSGGALVSWVHARDLACVSHFLLEHPEAVGRIYNVASDPPLSLEEMFSMMFKIFGYEWRGVIPYPKQAIAAFARMAMRLPDVFFQRITAFMQTEWERMQEKYDLSDDLVPRFDRDFVSFMLGDRVYDNTKIKQLGYTFRYPDTHEGFAEAIRWYQEHKWLPKVETDVM